MLTIRTMTRSDIPQALGLSTRAGWNQLEADWRRLLGPEPGGFLVAEREGRLVGTAGTRSFGPVAWVAMVLVDESVRRQGIGRALVEEALTRLDARGVATVRLDATPMGRPLYEQLGFEAEYELTRYSGSFEGGGGAGGGVEALRGPDRLQEAQRLDREVTGTDRRGLILRLWGENRDAARVVIREDRVVGFALGRPGARATQVGPCIADAEAGLLLLADAAQRLAGREVFVDVPVRHEAAVRFVEGAGLVRQRTLTRMRRGPAVVEDAKRLWVSSGPELG